MLSWLGLSTSRVAARAFSTTRPAQNMAKVTLIGRLVVTPEKGVDKQGRDIVIYRLATNDRPPPAKEDGTRDEPQTYYHRVLSYSPYGREYLTSLTKGTLVYVDADMKKKTNRDEQGNWISEDILLLLNRIDILAKPKSDTAEGTQA